MNNLESQKDSKVEQFNSLPVEKQSKMCEKILEKAIKQGNEKAKETLQKLMKTKDPTLMGEIYKNFLNAVEKTKENEKIKEIAEQEKSKETLHRIQELAQEDQKKSVREAEKLLIKYL